MIAIPKMNVMLSDYESPDHKLVRALLNRDPAITKDFFYRKCYPLFKAVFDNYHTDCGSCLEFINEIYLHILTPDKTTGVCKLSGFQFRSTLFTWLKTVCIFYCYKKYERKAKLPDVRISNNFQESGVRIDTLPDSIDYDVAMFNTHDVGVILDLMPNRRYSLIIRYVYVEGKSNEETAQILGMNMNTFYNKHKLAKDQFIKTLRKEELYHG